MVLVVFGHVLGGLIDAGVGTPPTWVGNASRALYVTHLPVFAFVTGLLIPAGVERLGARNYLVRRLGLLAYLYLVWTLLQGVAEVATSGMKNHATTWGDVLSVWTPLGHLWFLPTLAVATVVVVAVRPWTPGWGPWVGMVAVAAISLASWGCGSSVAGGSGLALLGWFTAGAAVTRPTWTRVVRLVPSSVLVVVLGLAGSGLTGLATSPITAPTLHEAARTSESVTSGVVATVLGVFAVMALSALISRTRRLGGGLAYVGQRALQVYLAHIIFAAGARVLAQRAGLDDFVTVAALSTAAGLLAGVPQLVGISGVFGGS